MRNLSDIKHDFNLMPMQIDDTGHFAASDITDDDLQKSALTAISETSSECINNSIFIAYRGLTRHGAKYISDAISHGAKYIITDFEGVNIIEDALLNGQIPDASLNTQILDTTRDANKSNNPDTPRDAGNINNPNDSDTPRDTQIPGIRSVLFLIYNKDGLCGVPPLKEKTAEIACDVYDYPTEKMNMIGVTGTNGKTTVVYCLKALLNSLRKAWGIITTVEIRCGNMKNEFHTDSKLTTPNSTKLQTVFNDFLEKGVGNTAMEVSSHALALGRVDSIVYDVAGFLNLSRDHLDFHKDIDDYFEQKAKLFTKSHSEKGLINISDEFGRKLFDRSDIVPCKSFFAETEECEGNTESDNRDTREGDAEYKNCDVRENSRENKAECVCTHKNKADYILKNIISSAGGMAFDLETPYKTFHVKTNLIAEYNAFNLAFAISLLTESDPGSVDKLDSIFSSGEFYVEVPGRMQVVSPSETAVSEGTINKLELSATDKVQSEDQSDESAPSQTSEKTNSSRAERQYPEIIAERQYPKVIVDFAHNPKALENILTFLRRNLSKDAKLITLFGAPGKRDIEKRPIMGDVVYRLSDVTIVTDDEPHSEDTKKIRSDIISGITQQPGKTLTEFADRRKAIRHAISIAGKNDIVLLAGRGHEKTQTIAGKINKIYDVEVAQEALNEYINTHNND